MARDDGGFVGQPMPLRRVVLTSFGPFPGVEHNASAPYVRELAPLIAQHFPGTTVQVEELPTVWASIAADAQRLWSQPATDLFLHFGVSRRIDGFVIETQCQNATKDAEDNLGARPMAECLVAAAPNSLRTGRIAVHSALRLAARSLPVDLSHDAGRYLCNALYYHMLWNRRRSATAQPVLFVHLPVELGDAKVLSVRTALACGLELAAACLDAAPWGLVDRSARHA